jgi:hypothetical protein
MRPHWHLDSQILREGTVRLCGHAGSGSRYGCSDCGLDLRLELGGHRICKVEDLALPASQPASQVGISRTLISPPSLTQPMQSGAAQQPYLDQQE